MFGLGFNHAAYLGLLFLALPAVAGLWYFGVRATIAARRQYAEERFLPGNFTLRSQVPALVSWLLAATLFVVALAGPTLMQAPQHARAGSMQVMVVMDVSNSMGAEDYKDQIPQYWLQQFFNSHGNRIDMAKFMIETQILPALRGNEVGMITYKGVGFEQAPPTDDYAALDFVIKNWIAVGQAPCCGTHPEAGLQAAIDAFKTHGTAANVERVIVLFSDGGMDGKAEDMAKVMQELKQEHIRLVVLGLGTSNPVKVPQYDPTSNQFTGYFQVDGKDAYTQIDESTLRQWAAMAGGEYRHITGADMGINWPTTVGGRDKVNLERADIYKIPLTLGFLCIIVVFGLGLFQDPQTGRLSLKKLRERSLSEHMQWLKAETLKALRSLRKKAPGRSS